MYSSLHRRPPSASTRRASTPRGTPTDGSAPSSDYEEAAEADSVGSNFTVDSHDDTLLVGSATLGAYILDDFVDITFSADRCEALEN